MMLDENSHEAGGNVMRHWRLTVLLLAALTLAVPQGAEAKMGRKKGSGGSGAMKEKNEPSPETLGAFSPIRSKLKHMRASGFVATGLTPVYPKDAKCPEIDSPFASANRYDGSPRSSRFYQGYHGGADTSVPEGTPILAIADGTLVNKKQGAFIGGIGLILRHSPEDTGLPVWTFTEYKHLKALPALEIGQRVKMGEPIALAGKTGTTGGHYGPRGHSHLHLTVFYNATGEFKTLRFFVPIDGRWMDPVALFKEPPQDSHEIRKLPDHTKKVAIPYRTSDGRVVPEGTKVVWPFACEPE